MLQSRNRSLKRRSRFVGFLIIVFAGCFYRLKAFYDSVKDTATSEAFVTTSKFVPPFLQDMYRQASRELTRTRLPPPDSHELRHGTKWQPPRPNYALLASRRSTFLKF